MRTIRRNGGGHIPLRLQDSLLGHGSGDGYGRSTHLIQSHDIGYGDSDGHGIGYGNAYGSGNGDTVGNRSTILYEILLPITNEEAPRTERIFRCAGCIGGFECSIHGRRL